MAKKKRSDKAPAYWHEACCSGFQHEFFLRNDFEYRSEFRLSKQPLRIDILVKKNSKEPVEKNIGWIFRTYNIIEYKSPNDYISVKTFYKAFGYAGLFCAFEDADPDEITITFVSRRYPRALMKYLSKKGVKIKKPFAGGYYIMGYPFPIQIIVGAELNSEENIWLASLCRELTPSQIIKLKDKTDEMDLSIDDYMSIILGVNRKVVEEVTDIARTEMKREFPELYSILINWAKGSDEFMELQHQAEKERLAKEEERRANEEERRKAIIILKQQNIPDNVIAVAFNTSADEISRLDLL
ncbi:MAG: hypothetical protein LBS62_02495 [Clostridiales bacterium]|jgi:hypothetical protein|nr:hypothetical protein [Clostridiales bacterium]